MMDRDERMCQFHAYRDSCLANACKAFALSIRKMQKQLYCYSKIIYN